MPRPTSYTSELFSFFLILFFYGLNWTYGGESIHTFCDGIILIITVFGKLVITRIISGRKYR